CPSGPAGCCASPPGVEWSDLGRIASLGGVAWLVNELAAGRLRPGPRGLLMARVEPSDALPRRCVYLGPAGCSVPDGRRAATRHYYLCDDAFAAGGEAEGEPVARRARESLDALVALYTGWDQALADLVRDRFPEGPPWDAPFFEWLGGEHRRLVDQSR